MTKTITIGTPNFNRWKTLYRLYGSICRGVILNEGVSVHWIICDDGSSENIPYEMLTSTSRVLITVIKNPVNKGLTSTRNTIVSEYMKNPMSSHIAFIDSDDYLKDNFFGSVTPKLEKEDYCLFRYETPDGDVVSDIRDCIDQIYYTWECQNEFGLDVLHVISHGYIEKFMKDTKSPLYFKFEDERWASDYMNLISSGHYFKFFSDVVAVVDYGEGGMSDSFEENIITIYKRSTLLEFSRLEEYFGDRLTENHKNWIKSIKNKIHGEN